MGTSAPTVDCGPLTAPIGLTATVLAGVELPPGTRVTSGSMNGLTIESPNPQPADETVVAVPELDATVTLDRGVPAGVLASIGPSPEGLVLAPGPLLTAPAGWRTVGYHGVQLKVPASWPSVDGNHGGLCSNPFLSPEVLVGFRTLGEGAGCPMTVSGQVSGSDGVWLTPSSADDGSTYPAPRSLAAPGGGTMEVSTAGPDVDVTYGGVSIELGLGPDPAVARTIFDSIRQLPGTPDTAVEGVSPSSVPTAMPTPERLTAPLAIENGQLTLDPPAPGDQAVMSAAAVWASVRYPEAGATYRLILAQYTSPFPATTPEGAMAPEDQGVLAWVIYAVPAQTSEGSCGNYSVSGFNATTSKPLDESFGYYPGP
ncbi:MAG: hypothetical protein ACRDJU_10725 [Actinomycetota bacterium]